MNLSFNEIKGERTNVAGLLSRYEKGLFRGGGGLKDTLLEMKRCTIKRFIPRVTFRLATTTVQRTRGSCFVKVVVCPSVPRRGFVAFFQMVLSLPLSLSDFACCSCTEGKSVYG